MGELFELVISIVEAIIPKKIKRWFNRQKKSVQYILGPLFGALLVLILALIVLGFIKLFGGGDWIF